MLAFVAAIFVSSLLGSMHCVGMCGPMALWASGVGSAGLSRREQLLRLSGYHCGRLITFLLAGVAAGLVGGMLTIGGDWMGWQQMAARLTGSVMLGLGVWKGLNGWWPVAAPQQAVGVAMGVAVGTVAAKPSWSGRLSLAVSRQIAGLRPLIARLPVRLRSVAIGVVTTWLPCGWLYLFVLVAAATASVLPAMLVMLAFWLGTLPALTALVAGTLSAMSGTGSAMPRLQRAMPLLVAVTMVLAGAYTASGRASVDLMPLGQAAQRVNQPLASQRWWQVLRGLENEPLPCCDPAPSPAMGIQ